jgi:hypothetical protein
LPVALALSRTGVLRVLFEVSSRCSVDLRGFGEVEVEGKIKANWRLLEAIVCTLLFELMPSGRGAEPAKSLFLLPVMRWQPADGCI